MSHLVNEAFAAHLAASDSDRPATESALITSLEKYAKAIVSSKLHEDRPDIVNEAVQSVLPTWLLSEGKRSRRRNVRWEIYLLRSGTTQPNLPHDFLSPLLPFAVRDLVNLGVARVLAVDVIAEFDCQ